ncbi:hypothetical protein L596_017870 [Steinernema carpocapsae]|uniref:Uncharacterized protein n=1 Tax=Steinernema carpocapsae TaxID=34508 RepID=A0A4U5N3R1_STECR|nr:hypothetical protein L596_017870 [Steinernema carpocapsae]
MAEEKARDEAEKTVPKVFEANGKVDHVSASRGFNALLKVLFQGKPPKPAPQTTATPPDEPSSSSTATTSTIVRSVSEYKANELAEDVRSKFLQKSNTTNFDLSPSKSSFS